MTAFPTRFIFYRRLVSTGEHLQHVLTLLPRKNQADVLCTYLVVRDAS